MKYFTVVIALILCMSSYAQTRRIGHRSHGGSMYTSGNHADGNYGEPYYPPYRITRKYDTIHFESGKDSIIPHDSMTFQGDTLHRLNQIMMPYSDPKQLGMICSKFTTR